jgi:hypothetical protein
MLKKIAVQKAVGTRLAHDITEIRPGEFKGAAFKKGILSVTKMFVVFKSLAKIIYIFLNLKMMKSTKTRRQKSWQKV